MALRLSILRLADQKLQNIINNLYKGTPNPDRVGNSTTMDAIKEEMRTGQPVGGTFDSIKGAESAKGLQNWLQRNPNAPYGDRVVAQSLLDELRGAMGGKP